MLGTPVAIAIGAVLGALSRYYITLYGISRWGRQFPYGTLLVNLTGALGMGMVTALAARWTLVPTLQTFLIVGFLGSYTTFSTYILDTANLFRRGSRRVALLYWLGSPILGFVGVELGLWLGHRLATPLL